VVDPLAVNPELGGRDGLEALLEELSDRGLGLLLDIVPNHMAFDGGNRVPTDLLENGPDSRYYSLRLLLRMDSYTRVLTHRQRELRPELDKNHPEYLKYLGLLYALRHLRDGVPSLQPTTSPRLAAHPQHYLDPRHETRRGRPRPPERALGDSAEWERQVDPWRRLNRRHKSSAGREVPDANDEYFL
jgi:hypothetical protein